MRRTNFTQGLVGLGKRNCLCLLGPSRVVFTMNTHQFILMTLLLVFFTSPLRAQCSCSDCPCQGSSTCPFYWPDDQSMAFYQADAPCGITGYFQIKSTALFPPDSFTVLAMNISSYLAYESGETYSSYSEWSTYSSVSCFDSDEVVTTDSGFAVVVICQNSVFQCRVIYTAAWEANTNCPNGTLSQHGALPKIVDIEPGQQKTFIKTAMPSRRY